ncbi:unnamed protein product [Cyclocybe aegerita]|uniref:Uncharacterized protein n=1 Tax=Cyclocybe aegerita TaxID=1973307 RepID=A0A8S0VSK2_CYCAE|nr:unnamed protein product [Cyclocybe aegerita]
MAPQRVADAANISPYPFVVRQGRPVIDPVPENPEPPSRSSKKAMAKARRAAERNARQEEEKRFNTGPRSLRFPPSNKGGRRFRLPGRGYEDRGIPDYPPPSFQEAMTSPPMSGCSSTTSLVQQQQAPMAPLVVPERIPEVVLEHTPEEAVEPTDNAANTNDTNDTAGSDENESDSDESIFIIDKNSVPVASTDLPRGAALEERVKMDWIKRRGVEFPIAPSPEPVRKSNESQEDAFGTRGRSTTRLPTLKIDPDPVEGENTTGASSPSTSAKRRFLSLSPLRTIFPPRSPVHQDRAMSAHPSPSASSSPYSGSRIFFRSTTSLTTASFLRLPLSGSTFGGKSEVSLTRKLFSHKGKERAKYPSSYNEPWEVVDESECDDADEEDIRRRPSLMAAVEAISSNTSTTSASPGTSPTRCQSFTFGSSHVSVDSMRTALPKGPHNLPGDVLARDFQVPTTSDSPSATVKVWKASSTAFIDRPIIRRPAAASDPPTPTCIPEAPEMARTPTPPPAAVHYQDNAPSTLQLIAGTPFSSVRSRTNATPSLTPPPSLLTKQYTAHGPSPLRAGNAKLNITIVSDQQAMAAAAMHQRALETPLPSTPEFQTHFDYGSPAASRSLMAVPPTILPPPLVPSPPPAPVAARSALDLLSDLNSAPAPLAQPTCLCRSASPPAVLNVSVHPSGNQLVKKSNSSGSVEEQPPMTPTRHHYVGRPLPRPPPSTPPSTRAGTVDSTYAAPEGSPEWNVDSEGGTAPRRLKACPEGLLIDLEDTSLDGFSASGTSTPRSDEGRWRSQSHLHLPMDPSVASLVDLSPEPPASAPAELSSLSFASMQATSTPLFPTAPGLNRSPYAQHTSPSLADLTDLDLLVSRLEDGQRDGTDYEVSPTGRQAWRDRSLNVHPYADPAPGLRDNWAREPASAVTGLDISPSPRVVNVNVVYLPESQYQRQHQHVARWAY